MLNVFDTAPDFNLPDQNGKLHSLKDFQGKWLFLYFYPKDDTSGCTQEACDVRDNYESITESGVAVIGISPDSVKSHKKFETKNELNFTLLADEQKEVVQRYDVWKEKSMYGRKYMGVERTSFLISPEGKIIKIYSKVNPSGHIQTVLNDLKELVPDNR